MNVKELAETLGLAESTIRNKARELFPELIENGKASDFSIEQATLIKMAIVPRDLTLKSKLENTNSDLEMMLMDKKVSEWKTSKIQELQSQLDIAIPKAIVYDKIADSTGLKTIQEIANILGIGVNIFFRMLRDDGIFYKTNGVNLPKSEYKKYFIMREEPYMHGENSKVYTRIFANAEGELWLARKYGREV